VHSAGHNCHHFTHCHHCLQRSPVLSPLSRVNHIIEL
jgi:hypothetical protein